MTSSHSNDRHERDDSRDSIQRSRPTFRSPLLRLALSLVLPAAALGVACSGEGQFADSLEGRPSQAPLDGPCEDAAVRPCGKTLEQASGTLTCYRGHQTCEAGVWGECAEGEITQEVDLRAEPGFIERENLSYSAAAVCTDNPCDPGCMAFIEDPPDIGLGGASSGPVGSVPTLNTCDHGLCSEGTGLADGCDPCTTSICATHPQCCDEMDPNGWGEECVNATYGICDGSNPAVSLCDFAVFSESSLTLLRDSSIIGGKIGATTSVSLQDMTTGSDIYAGTGISLDTGSYSGTLFTGGTLSTSNTPTYEAANTYEGITPNLPTIPTRSLSCLSPNGVTRNTGGAPFVASPGDRRTHNINNGSGVLVLDAPGDYANVQFTGDGTLVFRQGGIYRFNDLDISAGTPTILFPPGEKVTIETCSGLQILNGATVDTYTATPTTCFTRPRWNGSLWNYNGGTIVYHRNRTFRAHAQHNPQFLFYEPIAGSLWNNVWTDQGPCYEYDYAAASSVPAPFMVEWYTNSTGTVTLGPGALGSGVLIAPHATVAPQTGDFFGAIYAQTVTGTTDFSIDATGIAGTACVFEGIAPAASSGSCPIDTLPQPLNEPCVTGRDCQVNHRCVEPETGASCAHSKCAPGVALEPTCDECVDRICAVDSTCCSGEWDLDCVDMVATVCDATCDGFSCIHGPCEEGLPLEPSCDSCIDTVCNTSGFEDCCTDNWAFKCVREFRDVCGAPPVVTPPTAGGSICDYSAFGRNELQTINATMRGGWVGSPTSASQNISFSSVVGNATSSGSLNAFGTTITGDLMSGSGSVLYGTVLGSIINGTPPSPQIPNKALSCVGGSQTRSGALLPGSYGNVAVPANSTLTLSGGVYTFNTLTLGYNSRLELPSDGSIVEINSCWAVTFDNRASMTGLTQANAMNVSVYAEGPIAALGRNNLYGFFIAQGNPGLTANPCHSGDPCNLGALREGFIYVGPNSSVYGALIAGRRLDMRGNSLVDSTGLEEDCELLWDPGTTVTWPMCPVDLTPNMPNESATCEENLTGYADATCSGYDLALGIPCSDEVPVCNHGTTQFSGSVEVGYWDLSHEQLSTPTPFAPDGTCSGTLTIAPGECETLTCAVPMGEHTLMVDPGFALGECDDRRLDNWTVHDGRSCNGVVTPHVEVQRYEAVCPANSSPRWGLLTWNTTTPGTSTITFSGITAPDPGSFGPSPAYQQLGVAEASPTDTQACGIVGPSPLCPIDLTEEFALGETQDPFLELSIVLDGADMPVLEDWEVTYSCVVDQ